MRPVRSAPSHLPRGFSDLLGKPLQFDWKVQPGPDGKNVVAFKSNASVKAKFESGMLMVGGIAVQGAPSQSDIVRELKRSGQVSLEVKLERGLPVFDAKQGPARSR